MELFPYTNFHEMNLDWIVSKVLELSKQWNSTETEFKNLKDYVMNYFENMNVQDEINNKLDSMEEDGSLGAIISKLTQSYAINVVFAGINNEGTECTSELQNLINENPNSTFYFPDGEYEFYDVDAKNASFIFSNNAVITGNSREHRVFLIYTNAKNFKIEGGILRRGVENSKDFLPTIENKWPGVFEFNNCENFEIRLADFQYNTGYDDIALYSCSNVIIESCKFNWMLYAGVHIIDSCNGVTVRNCKFTNAVVPNGSHYYVYPIDVGVFDFSYQGESNRNVLIENNIIENSDWEGIDSHGCQNLIIRNNTIHNSPRFIMAYGDNRNEKDREYADIIIENNYCYNDDDYTPYIKEESETFFGISVSSFGGSINSNCIIQNNVMINTYLSDQRDASFIRTNNSKNVTVKNNRIEGRAGDSEKNIAQLFLNTTNIEVINNVIIGVNCNTSPMGFYNCTGIVRDNHFIIGDNTPKYGVYFGENCLMERSRNVATATVSLYNDKTNNIVQKNEPVLSDDTHMPNGTYYDLNFTTGAEITVSGTCVSGDKFFTTETYYVTPAITGKLTITDEQQHTHEIECTISWFENGKVYINATIPASGTCTFKSTARTSTRKLLENYPNQVDRTLQQIKDLKNVEIRQVRITDTTSLKNGVFLMVNVLEYVMLINPLRVYVYTRYDNSWHGLDLEEKTIN